MATRKEVAKAAGVSEATVSRVLNGVGPMKEETRIRVTEAATRLGYQLNAVASSFARGKSGNIGVVLPHVPKVHLFSTYYFSEIMSGIGEAVRAAGYGMLLLYRDPNEAYDYVSLFRTHRVDACLVLGASSLPMEERSMKELAQAGLPFCVVDQRYEKHPDIPYVIADHRGGSYLAVRHLLTAGHKRIGFLDGAPQYSNSADRLTGYREALAEAGELKPARRYAGNYSRTSGYQASADVYADLDQLDSMLCANDRMAIGLIQGLRERGVRLPQQLPIIGYDNADASSLIEPALTTVEVPFYEMGQRAADRVLTLLSSTDPTGGKRIHEVLPTRLIVRKSCGTFIDEPLGGLN